MTGTKKVTLKVLSEEINLIKDQMALINVLKYKVADLEIAELRGTRNSEETPNNISKCFKCDDFEDVQ